MITPLSGNDETKQTWSPLNQKFLDIFRPLMIIDPNIARTVPGNLSIVFIARVNSLSSFYL